MSKTDQVLYLLEEIKNYATEVEHLLEGDREEVCDAASELNAMVRNLTNNVIIEMMFDVT